MRPWVASPGLSSKVLALHTWSPEFSDPAFWSIYQLPCSTVMVLEGFYKNEIKLYRQHKLKSPHNGSAESSGDLGCWGLSSVFLLLRLSEQLSWALGGGCGGSSPAGLCSSATNCARENGSLEWKIVLIYLAEDYNDLLNNRSNFISIPQLL